MTEEPRGERLRWVRKIVISAKDGKLRHSGQDKPLHTLRTRRGLFIGCTFITNEALQMLVAEAQKC